MYDSFDVPQRGIDDLIFSIIVIPKVGVTRYASLVDCQLAVDIFVNSATGLATRQINHKTIYARIFTWTAANNFKQILRPLEFLQSAF